LKSRNKYFLCLTEELHNLDPVCAATLPYLFFIFSLQLFQLRFLLQQQLKFLLCLFGCDDTLWAG
jgi:hypothetical protein